MLIFTLWLFLRVVFFWNITPWRPTFRRNIPPPSWWPKNEPNKKQSASRAFQGRVDNFVARLSLDFTESYPIRRRTQWPRGLRHKLSSPPRTMGSRVPIPLEAWMSACVYSIFVLSCVQVAALRWADPPSKESHRLCRRSRKLKKRPSPVMPQIHGYPIRQNSSSALYLRSKVCGPRA
jgi:hypothetical protein